MKIGNQIRHRRTELNLSRGELANKIQVTPSAIANYENGVSYPKPDILVALMNALDRLSGILKKKAGMYFADAGAVKRKIDIFALVHAFIFFVNDQADQTFAVFREFAVF